ncbi:MAG: methylenetetrahydrofolate reductase [NAD(P)H] [Acidobacteria bacterium]|nr:methylenetetrahydrofolate reductase [NAD(P)H] [Acidobacteriota bacterium]
MTHIAELLAAGPTTSFEFFPPKTDEAAAALERTIAELAPLDPSFVSVTYGAGGSTRERTRDVVISIERTIGITAMAHLTCVGHSRQQLTQLLGEYEAAGVANILALAGDAPPDDPEAAARGDLHHAIELVELVRSSGDFSIGVAAHPEGHPRSPDLYTDRRHLADKLNAADFAITQFFFEPAPYLRLVEGLSAFGCDKPVIPGIMPVTNASQVQRFAQLAGAAFPAHLAARFDAVTEDPDAVRALGVELATELCARLLAEGVPGLHFYTLNRSTATREIAANLGLAG